MSSRDGLTGRQLATLAVIIVLALAVTTGCAKNVAGDTEYDINGLIERLQAIGYATGTAAPAPYGGGGYLTGNG